MHEGQSQMAEFDSVLKNKLLNIRNLLFLVTGILMAIIIFMVAGGITTASRNSERAEMAMAINDIIDSVQNMKLALAAERSAAYAGYGYATEVDSQLMFQMTANRDAAREAYSDVVAELQDLPPFDGKDFNEQVYDAVVKDFEERKKALREAHDRYRDQADTIESDLGTFRDNRELNGRGATNPMTGFIDAAEQVRNALEENYDFGDDRISQVIRLKHQLWLMIEYATRESASIGENIASGEQISDIKKSVGARYGGYGSSAWSQVKAILGSVSVVQDNTTVAERAEQMEKIQSAFFDDFEMTRFDLYDLSDDPDMDDEGNFTVDYGMTALEWVEKAREATAPVNDMALYADTLGKELNQNAVSEADSEFATATMLVVVVLGAAALAVWVVMFRTVRPINALSKTMMVLAQGKLEVDVPSTNAQDEVGDMARSVQVFKENAIERQQLEAEQREREEKERQRAEEEERRKREEDEAQRKRELEREEQARAERRQAMLDLADKFEASVMALVEGVSSSAGEMEGAARGMAETADDTSKQSEVVSNAAQQASSNAQMVASAAEELSASVREITGQTNKSSASARDAVNRTENAGNDVAQLVDAAQKIGDVVKLINDIAEQTNLLALNATIEAARAGDAGKGFAVVASEVKSLANQTAKATQEISEQVEGMQQATNLAVRAMDEIKGIIGEIESTSVSIASAVEQQDASTQEIARNVGEVSTGTEEVTSNIHAVNQGATSTGTAATEVLSAAQLLTQQSDDLRSQVENFLTTIRAE